MQREKQIGKNGDPLFRVSYPKFKVGEEVVRDVRTPQTYGMFTSLTSVKITNLNVANKFVV